MSDLIYNIYLSDHIKFYNCLCDICESKIVIDFFPLKKFLLFPYDFENLVGMLREILSDASFIGIDCESNEDDEFEIYAHYAGGDERHVMTLKSE